MRDHVAPKVFLSSTVLDLADLRSAVRYLLEQYGFEVLSSESADFPHDLDAEARVAALAPIDDADYYVLIVGFRRGSVLPEGISVTRSEYRRARSLHRETGRPQLVLLARQDVLEAVSRGPTYVAAEAEGDWDAIRAFVDEVTTAGNEGDPNWIHGFRSFDDLATVLRTALRLSGPLRRRALEANLIEELAGNAQTFLVRLKDLVLPAHGLLMPHVVPLPVEEDAYLDRHQTASIHLFNFALPAPTALAAIALSDAISSGEFLEFDAATGGMEMSEVQLAMLELRKRIARYESLRAMLSSAASLREFATMRGDRADDRVPVSAELRLTLYAVRDELENVAGLTKTLWRYLARVDETLAVWAMNPPTPLIDEARRIEAESITRNEAIQWALGPETSR